MRLVAGSLLTAVLAAVPPASDSVDTYVLAQLRARNIPGVSVAVVKDGRVVKAAGYGIANLELQAPATAQTVYELGSISKQFAADAVLLLAEDGALTLDDPLSKYIPGTPPAWSGITIRHVLTHTAGFADFDTGNIGFSYRREYTAQEFVDLLAKQPLQFAPGERWNYTNAFPLLGIVVEKASGQAYMDFVARRIFAPLKLTSARFKVNGDVVANRADGYLFSDGSFRHGETLRPAIIAANGGVMMNAVDFARWDIAITQGQLLRKSSLDAMTTPVRLTSGRSVSHGLGWFMDRFNGHRFGAHWGTTVTGHSAVIRRYTDDRVTVIVLGKRRRWRTSGRRDEQTHRRHLRAGRRHPGPEGDDRPAPVRDRSSQEGARASECRNGDRSGPRPRQAPSGTGSGTDRCRPASEQAPGVPGRRDCRRLAFQPGSGAGDEPLVSDGHASRRTILHVTAVGDWYAARSSHRRLNGYAGLTAAATLVSANPRAAVVRRSETNSVEDA